MKSHLITFLAFLFTEVLFSQFSFNPIDRNLRICDNIKTLSHDSLKGRMASTIDEFRAGNYIIKQMEEAKLDFLPGKNSYRDGFILPKDIKNARYFNFNGTKIQDSTFNIIGFINNHADQTIVLGAHYDHIGMVYVKDSAQVIYNGADDNASGVAAILELARKLKSDQRFNKFNFIIAAWCSEEVGLYGSNHFCENVLSGLPLKICTYINFDMVGRLGWKKNRIDVLGISSSPYWRKSIPKNFKGSAIRTKPAAFNFSDHAAFVKSKIPILYFTTGLPKLYHTPKDEFNYINIAGVLKIVELTEQILSNMDGKPIKYRRFTKIHYLRTTLKSISK